MTYTSQVMGTKNTYCYTTVRHVPLTTVRAMIKKFQTTGTVVNFPGRRHKCNVVPTHSEEDGEGGKEEPKRITDQERQTLVKSWGHKFSKLTL